jgi:hypothetical protein
MAVRKILVLLYSEKYGICVCRVSELGRKYKVSGAE